MIRDGESDWGKSRRANHWHKISITLIDGGFECNGLIATIESALISGIASGMNVPSCVTALLQNASGRGVASLVQEYGV